MPRKNIDDEQNFDDDYGKFNVGLEDEENENENEEPEEEEQELDFGKDNYAGLAGFSDDDE